MLVGVSYIIPVMQLMYGAQKISNQTGSQDLCYYNFLCRRTSKIFDDYGHVFSNLSYILCGMYFIVLVMTRRQWRRKATLHMYFQKNNIKEGPTMDYIKRKNAGKYSEFLNQCGIPEQYGIFLAMGGALVLEGLLSACYHVCPVDESFQFDTTFMYIIMVLIFLKMYQFRHPDITAKAHITFSLIMLMLVFEAAGYYWTYYFPFGVFLSIFVTVFLIVVYISGLDLYFKGDLQATIKDIYRVIKDKESRSKYKTGGRGRHAYYVLMIIVNASIALLFIVQFYLMKAPKSIVSFYLLFIFAANMTGYAMRYTFTKVYYAWFKKMTSESISWTCRIYILLAAISSVTGLCFFGHKVKNAQVSPSISRHMNEECIFLFFDHHDIWHLTSSLGLFFTFMALLTLEEIAANKIYIRHVHDMDSDVIFLNQA
jgi:hypothetical protein